MTRGRRRSPTLGDGIHTRASAARTRRARRALASGRRRRPTAATALAGPCDGRRHADLKRRGSESSAQEAALEQKLTQCKERIAAQDYAIRIATMTYAKAAAAHAKALARSRLAAAGAVSAPAGAPASGAADTPDGGGDHDLPQVQ